MNVLLPTHKLEGEMVTKVLKSHKGWVNTLQWLSNSQGKASALNTEFTLVSGSHDKSIKIWDIRSNIPLHTINVHSDKVLAIASASANEGTFILSGGADTKLHVTLWAN